MLKIACPTGMRLTKRQMCLAHSSRHLAPMVDAHPIPNYEAGIEIAHSGNQIPKHPLTCDRLNSFEAALALHVIRVYVMSEVILRFGGEHHRLSVFFSAHLRSSVFRKARTSDRSGDWCDWF